IRLEAAERRGHRPGTTNRGLLRRFASHRVLDPVRQIVETMETTWYGRRDCTRDDFTQCAAAAERIRQLLENNPAKIPGRASSAAVDRVRQDYGRRPSA